MPCYPLPWKTSTRDPKWTSASDGQASRRVSEPSPSSAMTLSLMASGMIAMVKTFSCVDVQSWLMRSATSLVWGTAFTTSAWWTELWVHRSSVMAESASSAPAAKRSSSRTWSLTPVPVSNVLLKCVTSLASLKRLQFTGRFLRTAPPLLPFPKLLLAPITPFKQLEQQFYKVTKANALSLMLHLVASPTISQVQQKRKLR